MLTEQEVLDRLRAVVAAAGSQKAYADRIGVSQSYLSDVLIGNRAPGEKILTALGLEAVIMYQKSQDRAHGPGDKKSVDPV